MAKDNKKVIGWVFGLMAALLLVFIYCVISLSYIDDLKSSISEKDTIIKSYEKITSSPVQIKDSKGNSISVDSLINENARLIRSASDYKCKLDLIEENYKIKVIEKNGVYQVKADEIDSALMLLESFRDAIKYNPEKKEWVVTRVK